MDRSLLKSLALAGFTLSPLAHALQVGDIQTLNGLGEPFEGFVPLVIGPGERFDPAAVEIQPDALSWSDRYQLRYLEGITADLVDAGSGRYYLRLSNPDALNLPLLSFRVRMRTDGLTIIRSYAVAPPAPQTRRPARAPRPAAPETPPAALEERPVERIEVMPGQTLSGIARDLARGSGRPWREVMHVLHAANPDAFINGNIDRLLAGAVLDVSSAFTAPAPAQAAPPRPAAVAASAPPAPAPEPRQPKPTPRAEAAAPAAPVRPAERTVPITSGTGAGAVPRVGYDPEVKALIAESSTRFAEIRARYAGADAVLPAPGTPADVRPMAVETAVAEPPPVAVDTAPADTGDERSGPDAGAATGSGALPAPRVAPAEPALAADAAGAESAPAPPPAPPSMLGRALRLLAPLAVALAVVGGVWRYRRRKQALLHAEREAQAEAQRKRAVSEKARQQLATQVKKRPGGRKPQPDQAPATAADTMEELAARVDEFDDTGDLMAVALKEIDDSIAHGRYERAEHDLVAVIHRAPRNWPALLRLLEVYYITEQVEKFQELAERLQREHRTEMPAEDWNKLIRMGKVLCPTHPLFGGLSLVETRSA